MSEVITGGALKKSPKQDKPAKRDTIMHNSLSKKGINSLSRILMIKFSLESNNYFKKEDVKIAEVLGILRVDITQISITNI